MPPASKFKGKWHLVVRDHRPMTLAANKFAGITDPVQDVRWVSLLDDSGRYVMSWSGGHPGMPIEDVRRLCQWAKSVGIPVAYDYGTDDPDHMLDTGIEGVG